MPVVTEPLADMTPPPNSAARPAQQAAEILPAAAARAAALSRLREAGTVDLIVIGGGATGLGVALDAALRGLQVVLLEAGDFAQGTSSRATKLVHGGVRYLAQGNIGLVREALHERACILAQAPHVAQPLGFVVPAYRWWEQAWYGAGLFAYSALAGARGLGPTRWLSRAATQAALPGVRASGMRGGVQYWDGQFDDARLAVLLARSAAAHGALVLNHAPVQGLLREGGRVVGVRVGLRVGGGADLRAHAEGPVELRARCVVNATGVWVDTVRAMSGPAREPLVAPSQGVHLVVDRAFLPGTQALLVPRTADGRVLFAVPWLGKTVLGTTDTPRADAVAEPEPFDEEVDFILREAAHVLARAPSRADVRSAWVGLRPLVRPPSAGEAGPTRQLSREHTVLVEPDGLVTVTGGKWTTYRAMAEDVLERCAEAGLLPKRPAGATATRQLLGAAPGRPLAEPPGEHLYGSEAPTLHTLPGAERWLARDAETGQGLLSEAMVRFAARAEMAASVEDVLARRSRLLFLDARQAGEVADSVAAVLADELGPGFDAEHSAARLRALAARYAAVGLTTRT
jgi:glycerol-3-phosphate dehydrogenase